MFEMIIMDYLKSFPHITREDIDFLKGCCWSPHDPKLYCARFKIINNQLYHCGEMHHNGRLHTMKQLFLETLDVHTISNCEFVLFYDDAINESNIHKITKDKIMPLIVCTSVLDKYNCILCPDFTFSTFPQFKITDHELLCNELVDSCFSTKIPKLIYKGDMSAHTRRERVRYVRKDSLYDCEHYDIESDNHTTFLSRKDRNQYKYYLHLNGRHGDAYSSALKYGLCNSVVFYSSAVLYREFWQHPSIFKQGEHYVYTRTPEELDERLNYYVEHEEEAEKIAMQAEIFFKTFLWKKKTIYHYIQLLFNEYAKRMTYQPVIHYTDQLLSKV